MIPRKFNKHKVRICMPRAVEKSVLPLRGCFNTGTSASACGGLIYASALAITFAAVLLVQLNGWWTSCSKAPSSPADYVVVVRTMQWPSSTLMHPPQISHHLPSALCAIIWQDGGACWRKGSLFTSVFASPSSRITLDSLEE
jgi:hypothetical protein